jgi:hypothetical protein
MAKRLCENPRPPAGIWVTVPADVRRVADSTPCTFCGVRPDVPCSHKRWAA